MIRWRAPSLTLRLVAAAALWSLFVILAGSIALSGLFADTLRRELDGRLALLMDNLIAAADRADPAEALAPMLVDPDFTRAYSGTYWQIEGPADGAPDPIVLARSRSLFDITLLPPVAVQVQTYTDGPGPDGQRLRMFARRLTLPGRDGTYTFLVAIDRAESEGTIAGFNRTLGLSALVLGGGLMLAIALQVRLGLQPLGAVAREIAAIRTGTRERLSEEVPEELRPLTGELNRLIDHNERLVERARRHVGNLAHALKTPLAIIRNETARRGADGALVDAQIEAMRLSVDRYLALAQASAVAGATRVAQCPVRAVIDDLVRTLAKLHAARSVGVAVECPETAIFRGDRADLEEILGNILDNAYKWASTQIEITVVTAADGLSIIVSDDGQGLSAEERHAALARGRRLDEAVPGNGLGLSIARDLVEAHGGSLDLAASPAGGLQVVVKLS